MFVRLVKKKNDHVSVRIVQNVRVEGKVKQKTVCCVGHFHKDNVKKIESYKRIGEELIIKIKNEEHPALPGFEEIVHTPHKKASQPSEKKDGLVLKGVETSGEIGIEDIKTLKEEGRICVGIEDVFAQAYNQLGLLDGINTGRKKSESNELLKEMVLSRIHKPSSKSKSVQNIKRDKTVELNLDKVYRMMDKVSKNEGRIKNKVVGQTLDLFKQKINVAFFDVTTLYFESFIPDELRVSGYSKDNKFKETQVVLSLLTTSSGLPLGYELFPGNTYEGSTLISAVNKLKETYDISDVLIVADRAMFTKDNLSQLDRNGVRFIISAKLKNMNKSLREEILNDVSKALKENENLSSWTTEYEYEDRRLLINYSQKRANKDKKDRQRLLDRIQKKMTDGKVRVSDLINNTGTKKYLSMENKKSQEATLDEGKIAQNARWDGIYGVMSNHKEFSGDDIIERYRGLWQIEEAFRVNKHDLKMRPIYHWKPRRIKAHILICFVAYALVTFVRYRLNEAGIKMSFEAVREELSYLQASIIKDQKTGIKFALPSRITQKQRNIYNALGLKMLSGVRVLNT